MATSDFTLPDEPLETASSSSMNIHRLSRRSSDVLLLEPGWVLWGWTAVLLALFPVIYFVCKSNQVARELTTGLCLVSLFVAAITGAGALGYHRWGTRVRFDRGSRHVTITGRRHGPGMQYAIGEVQSVQFCDGGTKGGEDGAWQAYQVNLVLRGDAPLRINLLDSGNKARLRSISKEIADFLGVPLYIGSNPT